jgi:hypothetical protein
MPVSFMCCLQAATVALSVTGSNVTGYGFHDWGSNLVKAFSVSQYILILSVMCSVSIQWVQYALLTRAKRPEREMTSQVFVEIV